ncbi:alpha-isopropylmalate synthase regulatory domain-containing protein [Streptomyces sp. NPDC051985]|uniref:alpha-isopropylmalate synthase regulatory domain-containing protein n=1 Tax=Streptomyces sp. NPDC051985 TaxID=3155807 RepID=UPI0034498B7D
MDDSFHVYATALHDGEQHQGVEPGFGEKLRIARHLDALGVGFIAGGRPAIDPRDAGFLAGTTRELRLKHSRSVAYGGAHCAHGSVAGDPRTPAPLISGAQVVTLTVPACARCFELTRHRASEMHLAAVRHDVEYLGAHRRRAFIRCTHCFEGYQADPEDALSAIRSARHAGADVVVLSGTNGGERLGAVQEIVARALAAAGARPVARAWDDAARVVANTPTALDACAARVQPGARTSSGRTGACDLFTLNTAPDLTYGRGVLPDGRFRELPRSTQTIADVVGPPPVAHRSHGGASAFTPRSEPHAGATGLEPGSCREVDPDPVETATDMLVPDVSGRASQKAGQKETENSGCSYEPADAAFELSPRHEIGQREEAPPFAVDSWRVTTDDGTTAEATVQVRSHDGPATATVGAKDAMHALDGALRAALAYTYPEASRMRLVGYQTHVDDGHRGTAAGARVLVSLSDGGMSWRTAGTGTHVLAAFFEALRDAYVHGLTRVRASREGTRSGSVRNATRPADPARGGTLTVTLRSSRGALARLAATLSSTPVDALSYETTGDGTLATAEVVVRQGDVPRALAKLNRVVDVLSVVES